MERFAPRFNADVLPFTNLFTPPPPPPPNRERPVSPESISENGDIVPLSEEAGNTRSGRSEAPRIPHGLSTGRLNKASPSGRDLRSLNTDTPTSNDREGRRVRRRIMQNQNAELAVDEMMPLTPRVEQQETPQTLDPRPSFPADHLRSTLDGRMTPPAPRRTISRGHCMNPEYTGLQPLSTNVVPTPPTESDENRPLFRPDTRRNRSAIPSRLNVVDNSGTNDGSLPSPSLSPVTAAANLHQNAGYFADVDSNSELASQQEQDFINTDHSFDDTPTRSRADSSFNLSHRDELPRPITNSAPSSSISDIPTMLDFFDAIPDELKSYVMHQLLRRCPKPTLQIVADVVNPALKCDFLGVLPPELALNIVKFLDLKSMCRASQVSKKWRRLINCDEKDWKEMFDMEGFILPEGELQRSIREGWGWQDPCGLEGFEVDISTTVSLLSESERPASGSSTQVTVQKNLSKTSNRRPKRKASSRLSNRNKQVKRKETSHESPKIFDTDLMNHVSYAEGPYNAANAAIIAVPHPKVGLPSLKDLHLYKSLYRRHYLIRKNWLTEEAKPHHIAFRAHENHVVTCLQFDTDKILTGSDDNNINVYDTKTGAVRAKLGGHEGGVWALQYEGNTLVSGSTDRSVRVWDIEQGRQTHCFRGHTSTVRCLQILMPVWTGEIADGKKVLLPAYPLIITGSRDSNLRIWRLPLSGDEDFTQEDHPPPADSDCPFFERTLTGHQHSVRAIAAHADTLVSGSYDCTVRVWKISTGETVHRLQGHTQKVYSVVLDHERNRCISGSMDNLVKIWSLDTGSMLHTLDGHSSLVGLLDLNCERLVSAAADSTLRIWDPENGQCKATLSAHTGAITCFQHDAQKVISGSDRTLKMWNVKTGECIKDLLTDLSGVWQVKFNERRCVAAVQRENMTYIEV